LPEPLADPFWLALSAVAGAAEELEEAASKEATADGDGGDVIVEDLGIVLAEAEARVEGGAGECDVDTLWLPDTLVLCDSDSGVDVLGPAEAEVLVEGGAADAEAT